MTLNPRQYQLIKLIEACARLSEEALSMARASRSMSTIGWWRDVAQCASEQAFRASLELSA